MAVQQNTETKNAPPGTKPAASSDSPDFTNPTAPHVEAAPGGRMDFMNLVNYFSAGAGITPEIEAYLKNVKAVVTNTLPNLEMVQLAEPLAAHAFIGTAPSGAKYAYVIIFTDAIGARLPQNVPMSRYNIPAFQALSQLFPGIHMTNAVLIMTQDLTRSRQMATSIVAALLPMVNPQIGSTQASTLTAAGEFVIDLNVASAQNFENGHSPHEVRPRADIGFTLALRRPKTRQFGGYGNETEVTQPFLAVTAMVEINGPQRDQLTGSMKYLPIVRITSITSDLPFAGSIMLGLVVAADYFISKRLWARPFSRFEKNQPNLGNLFPNPEAKKANELFFVSSQMELDTLISTQFHLPMLCVDVQEGHDRIPALASFINPETDSQKILTAAKHFFGVEPPVGLQVGGPIAMAFEGYYGEPNGRLLDTRNITYLNQVAHHGVLDQNMSATLLNYEPNPVRRTEMVASLAPGFVSMYETCITAVDSAFMGWVAGAVRSVGMRITDPTGMGGYVQMTALASYSNYSGFVGVVAPPSGGGFGMPRTGLYG